MGLSVRFHPAVEQWFAWSCSYHVTGRAVNPYDKSELGGGAKGGLV